MTTIAIIGAGAAGMMAAATIIESSPETAVLLFERNKRIGRKVAISGGGRCNVTTGITDLKTLFSKYPRGADFLKFAFKVFPPENVVKYFQEHGVALKCEEDMRVFPKSNNSEEVVELFEKLIPQTLKLSETINNIQKSENGFIVTSNKFEYKVDKVIITTGGNAFSHTGSKGDGYHFAKNLGHTITELGPSLNSFEVLEDWPKELSGLSLPKIKLISQSGEVEGPFLFTHFGISGPVVFALASHIPYSRLDKENNYAINLDLSISLKELNELIHNNGKKTISNVLSKKIPDRLSRTILKLLQIDSSKKSAELSKTERLALSKATSGHLPITLTARRPGDEFVTAGGVELSEVSPKTMESRLTPGLFFAGEILDIDGYTGGFNLQSSWATGRLAGLNSAK